ncbi:hypothetical protein RHMOL_Rhmol04G0218700 [Rhododendron molle]|uniref:Uncharacterized protein n=1 Tax=Rhododendron molle TaxID=49168 RepID=A0ACC0P3A2_RHOML|nr:hypothetical protein RHMOL_Rhmol04G0218700 [Rhododendron molle]
MDCLSFKIRQLKSLLKDFNKEFYSDIHNRVLKAKEELDQLQIQCLSSPSDSVLHGLEKDGLMKYVELATAEEAFVRQKSRVKWLVTTLIFCQ